MEKEICQELPRYRPIAVSFYDGIEIFSEGTLAFYSRMWYYITAVKNALVAQLDRVTGYEPVGRGFESLQARHTCGEQFAHRRFFYFGLLCLSLRWVSFSSMLSK